MNDDKTPLLIKNETEVVIIDEKGKESKTIYSVPSEKKVYGMVSKVKESCFNGHTIKGNQMPPFHMNLVVGSFMVSFILLHVLSVLIVENYYKTPQGIVWPCAGVYIFLLLVVTSVGWLVHKLELMSTLK